MSREFKDQGKTMLYIAGCAELNSEHVLGQAVVAYAKENLTTTLQQPTQFKVFRS
jgi:hypothetical protein